MAGPVGGWADELRCRCRGVLHASPPRPKLCRPPLDVVADTPLPPPRACPPTVHRYASQDDKLGAKEVTRFETEFLLVEVNTGRPVGVRARPLSALGL